MKKMISILALAISLSAHAQWSTDPMVNNAICTTTAEQQVQTVVSDGSGGAIITWEDYRIGIYTHIYAQRI